MEYTKLHNTPSILVSLDFRKAFDSFEWPFIIKTLDAFNFGTRYIKRVTTFYIVNIESVALNDVFWQKKVWMGTPGKSICSAEKTSVKKRN